VVDEIARAWLDTVSRASEIYAEHGGDAYAGFAWPSGSRESFLADLRGIEMGSDHEVFEEASFGVPMVYFHDWPDVTIHTNKDLPENLDATKLGRVSFLGAGIAWTLAALPDGEAPRLLAVAREGLLERSARAGLRADLAGDPRDAALIRREAAAVGAATLRSLAALWPSAAAAVRDEEARLPVVAAVPPAPAGFDARVPVRNPEVRGPLAVYYYDHLREVLGPDAEVETALGRRERGDILTWEALNLVDGRRSVQDIRDVLAGRYAAMPVAEVAEYLDLLARARVVSWK
jgi:aminopeptidase YwaD